MQSVFEMVRRAATRTPDGIAIVDPGRQLEIRYGELVALVERIAQGLAFRGVSAGDRVAVATGNSLEACITILALHRAGAVPAIMNPRLKPSEIARLIKNGEMKGGVFPESVGNDKEIRNALGTSMPVILIDGQADTEESFEALRAVGGARVVQHSPDPNDPAFIFYTSGTTGLPKGVVLQQKTAESRVLFMVTQSGYEYGPHNRIIGLMPMYHVIGFFAVFLLALAQNGTYYVVSEFIPAKVLRIIEEYRITGLFATPTHLDALVSAEVAERRDLGSLENVTFAGATMPDSVLARVKAHLPGRKTNIYGTTEAMNSLYARDPNVGTLLWPSYYSEVRVVPIGGSTVDKVPVGEEGELVVSANADAVFQEYLNQPEVTRSKLQNGWYRTSDVAVQHANGQIDLRGRVDDMIISGGENIHPTEVERTLLSHSGVAEVAVVGIPDDRWGQKVVACIVAKDLGPTVVSLDELCRASDLADFKRPRAYVFLTELPKNAMNKVIKNSLMAIAQSATGVGEF